MRITKLIINNFRAFKHAEIDFDDFSCIIGKNDSGKSTILAALEWFFDPNKELDENDFAAAGFDWIEYEHPSYYNEITGETYKGETGKDFIYDDFCISVDVYFSDAIIQKRTEQGDFIFSNDFISKEDEICIRKYMYYPPMYTYPSSNGNLIGYHIKKHFFKKIGKSFSDCNIEELKTAYDEIGGNTNELCKNLFQLEEECKNKRKGIALSALKSEIHNEEEKIKEKISTELYNHYINAGEKTCDSHGSFFEKLDHLGFHFGLIFPQYILYTSKTPINDYLNDLFTPLNASKVYDPIEYAKARTAKKISELLSLDGKKDNMYIKENEKIDLFTPNSLVFKQNDLPLNIPLKNRGEGFQLKIKNAVFRLLTEIQTKNQINTIFAFEEPETHLHPSAQIEMFETIKALSKKNKYQVIITTHSPYIVKKLAQNNIVPIVVKQEAAQESKISKLDERVLPYVSMNEINYIAFEEPSIEYHIELYGYMQNKLEKDVQELDDWLKGSGIINDDNMYDWYDTRNLEKTENKKTLPYCVRNNIDHPLVDDAIDLRKHNAYVNNSQFNNSDLIRKSIEIMRKAIINNVEFR